MMDGEAGGWVLRAQMRREAREGMGIGFLLSSPEEEGPQAQRQRMDGGGITSPGDSLA